MPDGLAVLPSGSHCRDGAWSHAGQPDDFKVRATAGSHARPLPCPAALPCHCSLFPHARPCCPHLPCLLQGANGKRSITPEHRGKLSEAQRQRWEQWRAERGVRWAGAGGPWPAVPATLAQPCGAPASTVATLVCPAQHPTPLPRPAAPRLSRRRRTRAGGSRRWTAGGAGRRGEARRQAGAGRRGQMPPSKLALRLQRCRHCCTLKAAAADR